MESSWIPEKRFSLSKARSPLPPKLPLPLLDHLIINTRIPFRHITVLFEFPVLVAVAAPPLAGPVVPLVLEAHGDAVAGERPQRFLQAIVVLLRPLAGQKGDDFGATMEEIHTVAPLGVRGVGEGDTLGIAAVPSVLGHLDFLFRRFLGEGGGVVGGVSW